MMDKGIVVTFGLGNVFFMVVGVLAGLFVSQRRASANCGLDSGNNQSHFCAPSFFFTREKNWRRKLSLEFRTSEVLSLQHGAKEIKTKEKPIKS